VLQKNSLVVGPSGFAKPSTYWNRYHRGWSCRGSVSSPKGIASQDSGTIERVDPLAAAKHLALLLPVNGNVIDCEGLRSCRK